MLLIISDTCKAETFCSGHMLLSWALLSHKDSIFKTFNTNCLYYNITKKLQPQMRTLLCHGLQEVKKEGILQWFTKFEIKDQLMELQNSLTFSVIIQNEWFYTIQCWAQFHRQAPDRCLISTVIAWENMSCWHTISKHKFLLFQRRNCSSVGPSDRWQWQDSHSTTNLWL